MAITDYIKSVDLKNNTQNILNRSITGKTFVANFGNNYWSVKITTVPMTRAQLHTDFGDFFTTTTDSKKEVNLLPILGTFTGTNPANGDLSKIIVTGIHKAGNTNLTILGAVDTDPGEFDYVSGTINAGNLFTIGVRKKIYMVVENRSSVGTLSGVTMKIAPPLVEDIANAEALTFNNAYPYFTNLTMQVIAESDITELKTNIGGYYTFSQTFREVI